ncbi:MULTISPECIES: hypothetical protein [Prauserella salsuginis group]|uniref:Sulfofructosephosphate aldolase n=1 Tax=Prauserella salsuginis TaxID=387889 RepID=A0ABW6GBT8_9PSEU|nr:MULTISPECIES: hypothetical protein [Prauserella salsuginis group]MCR3721686.1 sulfofructosephosphate aldolase [Prauserella flava]MCR3734378.1 sulfofructosephosphate aldolase [Prauserella salsuginis]
MTSPTPYDLTDLARPSGGFAMLAVDQREALRLMFAGAEPAADGTTPDEVLRRVDDATLTEFKLAATRALTPHASGVLLDKQFVFDTAVDSGAVAPGCGLIAAADRFVPGNGEAVTDSVLDDTVDPHTVRTQGAVAMKLLVVWRPDEDAHRRVAMVERFVARCRAAGLVSIIEPVSKAPRRGGHWDWNAGVHAAADELGGLGADLYKSEVPLRGKADADVLHRECTRLGARIASPWVVLSSGVDADDFPRAVEVACAAGASGFLAGRAVWRACVGAANLPDALEADAVPRLQRLADLVDRAVSAPTR